MSNTIFFGEVPEMFNSEDMFTFANLPWYFKLEVNTVDKFVQLFDVCNRMVPVDIEHITALIEALDHARSLITNSEVNFAITDESNVSIFESN